MTDWAGERSCLSLGIPAINEKDLSLTLKGA